MSALTFIATAFACYVWGTIILAVWQAIIERWFK